MARPMNEDALREALAELPRWTLTDGKLHRDLRFANFSEALGFLVRVGVEAEKMGHHPEIANVYSRVSIDLTTHDAGGVTAKDLALARAIDAVADG